MPVWAYFVIGTVILLLVLLTARRNVSVAHPEAGTYGGDFNTLLDDVEPVVAAMREAVIAGEERPIAMAASRARSRVHEAISNLDRLNVSERLGEEQSDLVETVRMNLRQAMENYEWAARIAETTDLIENQGLRRGFDSLLGAGDQLAVDARLQMVALVPLGTTQPAKTE